MHPLWLVSPFFFWGTAMIVMKAILPQTAPLFLGAFRLIPAGLLVLAAAVVLGRSQPRSWRAWGAILLFALVDGTLFQGFLVTGLARTQAGLGSVMIDSQPLVVALLAWWLYGEVIGLWGWLGLALGLTGIAMIALPPQEWAHLGDYWAQVAGHGEWWMLLAAVAMALGTVMMRWLSRWVDPLVATGWHLVLGGHSPAGAVRAVGRGGVEPGEWLGLAGHGVQCGVGQCRFLRVVFLPRRPGEPHQLECINVFNAGVCPHLWGVVFGRNPDPLAVERRDFDPDQHYVD